MSGFILSAGCRLKNRLLQILSCLLSWNNLSKLWRVIKTQIVSHLLPEANLAIHQKSHRSYSRHPFNNLFLRDFLMKYNKWEAHRCWQLFIWQSYCPRQWSMNTLNTQRAATQSIVWWKTPYYQANKKFNI